MTEIRKGMIFCRRAGMSRGFVDKAEAKRLNGLIEIERRIRADELGFAPMFGGMLSRDQGKTWRLVAICAECCQQLEPPDLLKGKGSGHAMNCDLCGRYNIAFRSEIRGSSR